MKGNLRKHKRNNCPVKKNTNMATDRRSASSTVSRGDTQTDAVAEAIQILSNTSRDDAEYDPDLFAKPRTQPEKEVKTRQMTSDMSQSTADHTFIEHIYPNELKYDCLEILILNAEDDENAAMSMKEGIENNVLFCGALKPVVTLLKDVIPVNERADPLDDAFKRTIYVMLYVTEEFCRHYENLHQSHSCLRRALNSKEEHWSIIPVHTAPKNNRKYELPLMLDGLRPLNYFGRSFYEDVKKLLEHKSNVILDRRATLVDKREQYRVEQHEKLEQLRRLSEGMKNITEPALKMLENTPEAPTKVPVSESVSQNRTSVIAQEQRQLLDSDHRSSYQKTKNITVTRQQRNQDGTLSSEASCMKSYLRSKRFGSEDHSLAITTDSPSSAEFTDESSEKDVSIGPNKQVGLQNNCDYSKNSYFGTVKSPTVTFSSLADPAADDKAVAENLNSFPADRSDTSHIGSHLHFPTGQSNTSSCTDMSNKFSEGAQNITHDTVPNISLMPSGNSVRVFPNIPVQDMAGNPNSRNRLPENTSTVSGSEIHIHIHQATNVAIGKNSRINVHQLPPANRDNVGSDDTDDSEDGHSYEI